MLCAVSLRWIRVLAHYGPLCLYGVQGAFPSEHEVLLLYRVHAKHIGHPLLGDDTYGPGNAASAKLIGGKRSDRQQMAKTALNKVARPSLHALTLGFDHPVTGERLQFCSQLPADFEQLLHELQSMD